jgi:ribosome-associated protein
MRMKYDVVIDALVIPEHELEITTSRAGGPGGQHVNKTDSRITVRWNIPNTQALDEVQKERVIANLQSRLTTEGDLIIHNSESRSQQTNKENALNQLAGIVRKALHVPKKRRPTRMSKSAKAKRVDAKTHRGDIKKMRSGKIDY